MNAPTLLAASLACLAWIPPSAADPCLAACTNQDFPLGVPDDACAALAACANASSVIDAPDGPHGPHGPDASDGPCSATAACGPGPGGCTSVCAAEAPLDDYPRCTVAGYALSPPGYTVDPSCLFPLPS